MKWALQDVCAVLDVACPAPGVVCRSVSIDTRTLSQGALFVALDGPNFDGADFVDAAAKAGAVAALTRRSVDSALPQIVVDDCVSALHALCTAWRARFDVRTIGITGSNGKTTMRSLVAALCGPDTHATRGNLNNHLGVPLVLFELEASHRYAVIEMGANHVGEIATLAALARPDIGIVTNAGPAHLEGFGGLDGVARGKGEMFEALGAGATAVINRDDHYFDYWLGRAAPARILSFGSTDSADVWYSDFKSVPDGSRFEIHHKDRSQTIALQLAGEHNAMNTAGACAVALAAGIDWTLFAERLASVEPVDGRQVRHALGRGITLIDDSYNANPGSMRAAADALVGQADKAWMVVGDMLELGDAAVAEHQALGTYLRDAGIAKLFAFGQFASDVAGAFGTGGQAFTDMDTLNHALTDELVDGVAICVKGSRSTRMERVVEHLMERC